MVRFTYGSLAKIDYGGKMDKKEKKLKLFHGQILELIKSYEGKNFIGKLSKNRQDIRNAYLRTAKDLFYKMNEIDINSAYIKDIYEKLPDYFAFEKNNFSDK